MFVIHFTNNIKVPTTVYFQFCLARTEFYAIKTKNKSEAKPRYQRDP